MEMWLFWLILSGVLFLLEIFTVGFLVIWPAIGAFIAFIASLCGLDLTFQVMLFAISTVLLILFMKPILNKLLVVKESKMNTSSLIGKTGIVTKEIIKDEQSGQIKVDSEIWTAVSLVEDKIDVNEKVVVEEIDGVKLIVKKI